MFKPVDTKQSFPKMENDILKYWQENKIFEKSVSQKKDNKKFVFFDGPPFANGLPHYGHILANSLKDAVTRYFTMRGFFVPRTNGWDCHGLPVEYEIEKELGLSGKKDIETLGIEKFNEKCRSSVFKYTAQWEELLKRIARWVDFSDSYATLDNDYMESIWWVFSEIYKKGLIYQGYKSMHICPRCETPLSNFEVSQGYKDVTDLSVTCKFKLVDDDAYILAWTTTPWTLPGNVALCIGPNIKYVRVGVKFEDGREEIYILAKDRVEAVLKDLNYNILEEFDASALKDKKYVPLFDYYPFANLKGYKVVVDEYVSTEEGTGVVHIAPMFGEDDFNVAKKTDLPLIQHVAMNGTFNKEVIDFEGKFVKGQDRNVVDFLAAKGLVFSHANIRHSYPHCWRCNTPLLNYSTKSLFVKVTDIKDDLLKNNEKIHWQPERIKEGRFGKWLEGARDWAISRNRYWGCPIPLWQDDSGYTECIGSIEELKAKTGGKLPMRGEEIDLHKPYIDEITYMGPNGKEMRRIPDVLDCWFESGSMPYAQLHYPFENKELFESNFPANFIAEGQDQTRGWFYTLHVLATILFNKPAFQNVIVNGVILTAEGEKLSKSKKNYPDPSTLFESKGVDSLRMLLYSSPAALADDVRFSDKIVEEVVKKFTLTLWNTYGFFVTYANIDKWDSTKMEKNFKPQHKLDQWILSELNQLIATVTESMEDYNLMKATRPMFDFVDGLSNWYVRRSRRRFWKSESDMDKMQAYQTLYTVLVEFSKLLAPFMPYVADEVFINLTGKESVHLEDWPVVNKNLINEAINTENRVVRSIVALGHAVRDKANIKVRQPLSLVQVALPHSIDESVVNLQKSVICEELNVKDLVLLKDASDFIKTVVTPNAKVLGPKYGGSVQEIIRNSKEGKFELLEGGTVKIGDYVLEKDEVTIGYQGKEGSDVASDNGISVILNTEITKELRNEGYARDIVRVIQDLRKEANYSVDDRIYIFINTTGDVKDAVIQFADYICKETLSIELISSGSFEADREKTLGLDGVEVKIAVRL